MKDFLRLSLLAAKKAGDAILEVYNSDFSIQTKSDNSPLTLADTCSHNIINSFLSATGYPVLSEEGKEFAYSQRKTWETFWMIDPLDGTKEFVKKNGEFTVNIAFIQNQAPVLGVVYAPVIQKMYYGVEGLGSFSFLTDNGMSTENIDTYVNNAVMLPCNSTDIYKIAVSVSHTTKETDDFIEEKRKIHGTVDVIVAGSSLKLCLVAEGKANIYPRLAPTWEWDTAAGHAVAKYAGCLVYDYVTGLELVYNKENLLNPWFVAERQDINILNTN